MQTLNIFIAVRVAPATLGEIQNDVFYIRKKYRKNT